MLDPILDKRRELARKIVDMFLAVWFDKMDYLDNYIQ